jgi:hypothetical protein
MKFLLVFILSLMAWCNDFAQVWKFDSPNIPNLRKIFHDKIDLSQRNIIGLTCKRDSVFIASDNNDFNLYTTAVIKNKIDYLQYLVETDPTILEGDKYKWLRGIDEMLQRFIDDYKDKNFNKVYLVNLINSYADAMELHRAKKNIASIIEENELEVGNILISNFALQDNEGIDSSKLILVYKLCKRNPEKTLQILKNYPELPQAESLITDFAYLNPQQLYNYAAANTALGNKIRTIQNPMVSTIVQMANAKDGRFLFPFLDDIIAKNISIEEIRKTIDNNEAYFKLLVNTQEHYEMLKQQGVKVFAFETLIDKLKAKAIETYITPINALHDEPNPNIRFAKIQNLTPKELYFIAVMGEEEVYTSSFINGIYPKIIEGLGKIKTDSLFKTVHYAYYRKFIKMCASFNMLENFLAKMDKPVAENLMKSFSNNLEQYWGLEEAVNVADSYASIKDSTIKNIILNEVVKNYESFKNGENKKGKVIYGLLYQIFNSIDSSKNKNYFNVFDVPLVFQINNNSLKDAKGRIHIQQFFYGDKDGKNVYNNFVNNFKGNGWHIINKEDWIEVNSTNGTAITIYANKPLNEEEGLDDAAQSKLYNYLDSLNIYPSVAIHRGHSYYVKTSINQITSYAKLILLGSCGGYFSLSKVLNISPQAQVIASKQIGTGVINSALIEIIMEQLKQGKDLYWPTVWKSLEQKFSNRTEIKEKFDDYIPPYKNLGAIFMMSYHKAMNTLQ